MKQPAEQWLPVTHPSVVGIPPRDPKRLVEVIEQFNVATHARYASRGRTTWCNIFMWDVTSAMACEIPHWYDPEDGRPTQVARGLEMRANDVASWMRLTGDAWGWSKVDEAEAAKMASEGACVVAAWHNPNGTGHVAILRPESKPGAVRIAQAGARNFSDCTLHQGFGFATAAVEFFAHG